MPITHLTDFSDKLSPMLVKELRQGMRAKTFIAVFLSLQIFLAVMLFSASATSTSDHVGSVVSGIIFMFFATAVLLVQPLRGIGALSSEVKGNTIDMMVLTRLSAWRIVFGKWVAIVSQSALLLSTIIPYLILRYFFGGMNLVAELTLLIVMFLTSMALTAFTVGLSGCSSIIVRALLPIFGLPMLMWTIAVGFVFRGFRGSSGFMDVFALDSTNSRIGMAVYVAAITYLGGLMLSLGTSLIAPAAENHALVRRLVALVAMLILVPLGYFEKIDKDLWYILTIVITIPAIVIALTESAPLVATVCKPFVKRGRLGKAIGWLLYPTWASGILFSILIGLIGLGIFLNHVIFTNSVNPWDSEGYIAILALFGGLFFPAAWQAFLFRGEGQRLGHYLLLLVGSGVMLGILTALSESMDNGLFLWFFAWNPLAFLAMLTDHKADKDVILGAVALVDILLLVLLITRALIDIRKSAPVILEVENSLKTRE
jgi:ABC-type transport system involved in multi-copper enzyme maturation permease subunit